MRFRFHLKEAIDRSDLNLKGLATETNKTDRLTGFNTRVELTSTAKQVLGNCERMVLANLIGNRLSTFIL